MKIRDIIEGDVVDFGKAKLKKEVSPHLNRYVNAAQSEIAATVDRIKRDGKFGKFLDHYYEHGLVPHFELHLEFDTPRVADRATRQQLRNLGFGEVSDRGWNVYDDEHATSWMNDAIDPNSFERIRQNPTNYYTVAHYEKPITDREAEQFFTNRSAPEIENDYGRFNTRINSDALGWDVMRYHKNNIGQRNGRWDIRTHARHGEFYHNGRRWYVMLVDDESSQMPRNEAEMQDALTVYRMIQQEETLKTSGGNVKALRRPFQPRSRGAETTYDQ